jgi:WD40 repeat protein
LPSAGEDGSVRLWDLTDPAAPTPLGAPLTGHDGGILAVAFTPDGHTLTSAGVDGTVRLWNLTGLLELRDHAMKRACVITGGGPTHAEWDRYVEGLPYVDVCKT